VGLGVSTGVGAVEALGDPWILSLVAYGTAGALLVLVRPDLRYSWLLLGASVALLISMVILVAAETDVADPALVQAIGYAINTASVVVSVPLIVLLFPDGRLPSRRWRPVVVLTGVSSIVGASAALLNGGWGGDPLGDDLVSPLAGSLGGVGTILTDVFFPLMLASFLLGALSLLLRFRRSDGVQRRQLLWVAVAGGYMIATALVVLVTIGTVGLDGAQAWMMASAFALFPVAITVAVLRYRLYDVDIIVNRSLVVGGLAVFILAVYVGLSSASERSSPPRETLASGSGSVQRPWSPWGSTLRANGCGAGPTVSCTDTGLRRTRSSARSHPSRDVHRTRPRCSGWPTCSHREPGLARPSSGSAWGTHSDPSPQATPRMPSRSRSPTGRAWTPFRGT
jgi:hypothetical protein